MSDIDLWVDFTGVCGFVPNEPLNTQRTTSVTVLMPVVEHRDIPTPLEHVPALIVERGSVEEESELEPEIHRCDREQWPMFRLHNQEVVLPGDAGLTVHAEPISGEEPSDGNRRSIRWMVPIRDHDFAGRLRPTDDSFKHCADIEELVAARVKFKKGELGIKEFKRDEEGRYIVWRFLDPEGKQPQGEPRVLADEVRLSASYPETERLAIRVRLIRDLEGDPWVCGTEKVVYIKPEEGVIHLRILNVPERRLCPTVERRSVYFHALAFFGPCFTRPPLRIPWRRDVAEGGGSPPIDGGPGNPECPPGLYSHHNDA